ncbi:MAG: hypothetical protein V5A42_06220 [Halofilum sp. (in: g-proteobacteria)]
MLLTAYPPLMAGAIVGEVVWLEAMLLPLAAAIIMAPALARGRWAAWLVLLVVAAVSLMLRAQSWLGLWPPVVVTAGVAARFALSLRNGSMPLIERFARAVSRSCGMQVQFSGRPARWMRAWTAIWALILAVGAVALAWVALGGYVTLWAWLSLALPLCLLLLLCLEYALRRVFLPDHARMTLIGFLTALLATDWTDLPR